LREKLDFILKRHSCREFLPKPLRGGDLELLMEALRWAPSAGNCQPWVFYIVTNDAVKQGLVEAAYGQSFLADAAVIFVVCVYPEASACVYGDRGRTLYCLQDTAAAVENLLLAATTLGYGSCWIGAFSEKKAREVLDVPAHLRPVAIVPVGPGAPVTRFPSRKPVSEIFEFIK
jgi:nitroreductase